MAPIEAIRIHKEPWNQPEVWERKPQQLPETPPTSPTITPKTLPERPAISPTKTPPLTHPLPDRKN